MTDYRFHFMYQLGREMENWRIPDRLLDGDENQNYYLDPISKFNLLCFGVKDTAQGRYRDVRGKLKEKGWLFLRDNKRSMSQEERNIMLKILESVTFFSEENVKVINTAFVNNVKGGHQTANQRRPSIHKTNQRPSVEQTNLHYTAENRESINIIHQNTQEPVPLPELVLKSVSNDSAFVKDFVNYVHQDITEFFTKRPYSYNLTEDEEEFFLRVKKPRICPN